MSKAYYPGWIDIKNKETGRSLTVVEQYGGDCVVTTTPPTEVIKVKKKSVGKQIREFMKEVR